MATMSAEISGAACEINRLHGEICQAARTTIDKAIRIGELLAEQKARLKHGEWLPWLKANVQFTARTASNYQRVFENRLRLKSETISDLTDAYDALAERPEAPSPRPPQLRIPLHPLCEIYPWIDTDAFEELVQDIRQVGLLHPITTYEGKILDGKLRYEACLAAGVEPTFKEYKGDEPESFVVSANNMRSHWTPGQISMFKAMIIQQKEEFSRLSKIYAKASAQEDDGGAE
jgi:hypothetical protein